MKICLIGTVASSTLNFRKSLIELMVLKGHEVYVFSTDFNPQSSAKIITLGAIPIDYKLSRSGFNPFADIFSMLEIKNKFCAIQPDIVFSYFAKPVIFGTFAAKLAKVPRIVGMLEGLGYAFTPEPPHQRERIKKIIARKVQVFLYSIAFKFLDNLIFLNKDDPFDLLDNHHIKVKNYQVLGGIGVDLQKFKPTPPPLDPIRFLFIGRLIAEKGIFEFIQAAEIVKQKYPTTEFIVLGDIDPENPSSLDQSDLDYYKNNNIIIHPGHVENIQDWIKESSVFVLPSYYREGIPRSTQEAMACGRTVITTNLPGCRETITKNSLSINPFDAKDLSEKIIHLIENSFLITRLGRESRNFSEKNFNKTIQDNKLYSFILNNENTTYYHWTK